MAEVKKVHDMEGVFNIKFDMCRFGMAAIDPDDGELKPVQKRTAILTNYYGIANRMRRDFPNLSGDECTHHTHLMLEGGTRCKQAQIYARDFTRTICEGIAAQRRLDSMNLDSMEVMSVEELVVMGHDELQEDHMTDTLYEAYGDVPNDL